jgi:hypothetical protein
VHFIRFVPSVTMLMNGMQSLDHRIHIVANVEVHWLSNVKAVDYHSNNGHLSVLSVARKSRNPSVQLRCR